MPRLDGKAAIVTGAGQGIGRGVARAFAREGAAVTIAEINAETGRAVARELEDELSATAVFVPTDVLQQADVQGMVDATVDAFGRVDILVNNAYVAAPVSRLEHKSGDDLLLAYRGGPLHTLWAMQAVFPHMVAAGGGRIINFVSLNGINAHMYSADYNAAKEAIRALTRTAAREWAIDGIVVNAIAPAAATHHGEAAKQSEGYRIFIENCPMRRQGDPELDIGPLAWFLCSDACRYLTGHTFMADGGAFMWA